MCLKPLLYLCFTPINIPILSIVNTLLHHVIVSSYREFYHDIIYTRSYLPFYYTILYYLRQVLYSPSTLHYLYYTIYIRSCLLPLYQGLTFLTLHQYTIYLTLPLLYYTITLLYYTIHYSRIVYNKTTLTYKGILLYLYRILYLIVSTFLVYTLLQHLSVEYPPLFTIMSILATCKSVVHAQCITAN